MSAAAPPSIGPTPTTTTTHTPSLSSLKAAADGNPPPSLSSSSSTLLAAPPLARLSTPATATTTTTAAPAAQYHYYHAPPSSSSVAATAASSSSSSSSLYSFSSPSSPTSMALSFPPLHGSSAAVAPVRAHIVALNREIGRLRRRGDPSFADVQALAERTWRANLEYEAAVARLDREKAQLNRLIDSTWIQFDTLIRPLWRIDDTLVPAYDALAGILTSLEDLANRQKAATDDYLRTDKVAVEDLSFEVRDLEQELWRLQDALHAVENRHVVEGRFYSAEAAAAWKGARNSITNGAVAAADEVPGGQALLSNLLARCHRLVRKIQEAEVSVHPSLYSTQIRLENIVAALRAFRAALASPGRDGAENDDDDDAVDPADLRDLQARLDAVDAARVDGKFVAAGLGATAADVVVEGQAILSELLNEGYDLVHECLVELETRRAPDRPRTAATTTADASTAAAPSNSSSVLLAVTDRVAAVRDALLGLAFVTGDRRAARAAATSATASATAAPAEEEAEEEEEDDALAVGGRRAFTFRQRVPQDKDDGGKPVPTGGSDAAASAPAKPGYADLLGTGPALHSLADTLFAGFTALRGTLAGGAAATTTTIAAATSAAPRHETENDGGGGGGSEKVEPRPPLQLQLTAPAVRLASVLRSGLGLIGAAVGAVDPVDPRLAPTRARLARIRDALTRLRNRRNQHLAAQWAASVAAGQTGATGQAGGPTREQKEEGKEEAAMRWRREWAADEAAAADRLELRTQVAALDEIDAMRDADGAFVAADGEDGEGEAGGGGLGAPVRGQAVLKALLEECYCIAYDLLG